MKKVILFSIGSLLLLNTTVQCQDLLEAEHEATHDNVVITQDLVQKQELIGPQLPSKEKVIKQFMMAAVAVSEMGRYGIGSSQPYAEMKETRQTLLTINKGDKQKTAEDIFDGYNSGDDEYYTHGLDNEEKTAQQIRKLDATLLGKLNPKIAVHEKKTKALQVKKEAIDKTIDELLFERANLRESLNALAEESKLHKQAQTMFINNKEQENSLLRSRKERLTAEIKAVDERLEKHKNDANSSALVDLLENDITKSIAAAAIKDVKTIEIELLAEKKQLEEKLQKIEKVLSALTPKQGSWFAW